jgi:hypothetical protein
MFLVRGIRCQKVAEKGVVGSLGGVARATYRYSYEVLWRGSGKEAARDDVIVGCTRRHTAVCAYRLTDEAQAIGDYVSERLDIMTSAERG